MTSRLDYLAGRDQRAARKGPTLADALDPAGLERLRIRCHWDRNLRPWHDVVGFTASFVRLQFEAEVQADLFIWALTEFPGIDWTRDHEVVLATGVIHAAPDADQAGFIPDDEFTFGPCLPAVYVQISPGREAAAV